MNVEGPCGETLSRSRGDDHALRDRYVIQLAGSQELEVQGNILDHEFRITAGSRAVAEARKSGSASETATVSRSRRARMTPSFWRPRLHRPDVHPREVEKPVMTYGPMQLVVLRRSP